MPFKELSYSLSGIHTISLAFNLLLTWGLGEQLGGTRDGLH